MFLIPTLSPTKLRDATGWHSYNTSILEIQYPYRSSLTNNDIGKERLKITQKNEKRGKLESLPVQRTTSHVLQSTMKRSFDNNYRCT